MPGDIAKLIVGAGKGAVGHRGLHIGRERLSRGHEHSRRPHGNAVEDDLGLGVPGQYPVDPRQQIQPVRPAHAYISALAFAVAAQAGQKPAPAQSVIMPRPISHAGGRVPVPVDAERPTVTRLLPKVGMEPQPVPGGEGELPAAGGIQQPALSLGQKPAHVAFRLRECSGVPGRLAFARLEGDAVESVGQCRRSRQSSGSNTKQQCRVHTIPPIIPNYHKSIR
ncbi:hypothetical protein SDC9_115229 [bioreactor metagenome]|uniref:Uncharacterized protein n=1 Tax=bioreactor metagenome TaxID=1076179 RepID=A0A645BT99_9ZZZZ